MSSKRVWNGVLALFSVAISLSCIGLGVGAFFLPESRASALIIGAFLLAYGLTTIVLLGMACWRPSPSLPKASKVVGIAFFGVLFVGSLDVGRISGLEFALLAFVGGILWVQFVAVRRLSGSQA